MTGQKWTTMATIAKTHERCVSEGIGISRNLIRQLVLSGTIPSVKVGKNTHLINWDCLMAFLKTGSPRPKTSIPEDRIIQRIETR